MDRKEGAGYIKGMVLVAVGILGVLNTVFAVLRGFSFAITVQSTLSFVPGRSVHHSLRVSRSCR